MNWRAAIVFLLAAASAPAATNDLSKAEVEGRKIINHILETRPAANYTNSGTLTLLRSHKSVNKKATDFRAFKKIPVQFEVWATPQNWVSVYQNASPDGATPATRLRVVRERAGNRYELATLAGDDSCCPTNVPLTSAQAMAPFAGSDFWMADLGLEFFQWPVQRLLREEKRRTRPCYVIESVNPAPGTNGYSRVISWLDIESVQDSGQPAIVHADAYDSRGKLLKEFLPKSLEKVNGQYQLGEMEIINKQAGTKAVIEFKFQ